MQKYVFLNDKIYGKVKITSPVIQELINSKPLLRLKGIGQFGIPDEFYHLKNYSRYEHSLGVMILLKTLGANEEEQVAGLLHDISHTAFSHVIDWVVGEGHTEDYQDSQHEKHILDEKFALILKKHKYNPLRIANHSNFPLLEKDIPSLCADRIDYSLKEFPLKIAKKCFKGLNVIDEKIVFNNKEIAFLFAKHFLDQNFKHWGGFEAVNRYRLFANVLKIALSKKEIAFSDFQKDDLYITNILKRSKDKKIQKILSVLRNKSLLKFPKSKRIAHKKFRYVDPLIFKKNKFLKLSEIDFRFKNMLNKKKEFNEKGIRLLKMATE